MMYHFLDLPQELRDRIYKESFLIRFVDYYDIPVKLGLRWHRAPQLSLLLVNKQINREVLDLAFLNAHLRIEVSSLDSFRERDDNCNWKYLVPRNIDSIIKHPCVGRITRLDLDTLISSGDLYLQPNDAFGYEVGHYGRTCYIMLRQSCQGRLGKTINHLAGLRQMTLHVSFYTWKTFSFLLSANEVNAKLPYLMEQLGCLASFIRDQALHNIDLCIDFDGFGPQRGTAMLHAQDPERFQNFFEKTRSSLWEDGWAFQGIQTQECRNFTFSSSSHVFSPRNYFVNASNGPPTGQRFILVPYE